MLTIEAGLDGEGRRAENRVMWQTFGHPVAVQALERALEGGSPAHAWLFTGPEAVGKRSLALEFATALNCTKGAASGANQEHGPCGHCRDCRDTLARNHPDVEL